MFLINNELCKYLSVYFTKQKYKLLKNGEN